MSRQAPANPPVTSTDVHDRERSHHIGKSPDEPLVGLALSGGGIRSATFGLGVLQGLYSLGVYERLDYISTVSGGGYIGGWLQAAVANGRVAALERNGGQEPREIRFLRGYSNYLTPKLGLFSGDTWAAVGNSLRNLILNFTILSLSLIAPLYLPWLAAGVFWHLVPDPADVLWLIGVAGLLYTLVVAASTANMARPLRQGGWTPSGASQASPAGVYGLVIVPALVATWLVSTLMWSWARAGYFQSGADLFDAAWKGALGYAAVWTAGLVAGFTWRQMGAALSPDSSTPVDYGRAVRAGLVLVVTGAAAGWLATLLMGTATHALAFGREAGAHSWLLGLLAFPVCLGCLMLAASAHIGLAGDYMSDETREWWGRVGGVQLLISLALIVLGAVALLGPHTFDLMRQQAAWFDVHESSVKMALSAAWAVFTGIGVLAGRSRRTGTGRGHPVLEFAGTVAPVVFVFGYLLILATLIHTAVPQLAVAPWGNGVPATFEMCEVEAHLQARASSRPLAEVLTADTRRGAAAWNPGCRVSGVTGVSALGGLFLMLVSSGVLAWLISWRVNLNEFSLHTFYRNRLVRCFLGASRRREPHPFTGFDAKDDVPLATPSPDAPDRPVRPYPIFNTAINLVAGKNLAWQERKAASFVFTPEYCGFEYRDDDDPPAGRKAVAARAAENAAVRQKEDESGEITAPARAAGVKRLSAYARTREHANNPRSITMGLAIATSGAAASPNMGYHSSPTLAFLMTVFNVRLGWWLRNPRFPAVWKGESTHLSLRELLYELLGMTTDDKKWVYLSDGGHFENLGVYELVRRRCRFIIACDAGQDGDVTFEDLGNAIERCRADFGVNIEIDLGKLALVSGRSERHCAIGTIRYDSLDARDADGAPLAPGTLLYIKTSLTGDEPTDILSYAARHPSFPHQSTSDQFFDEAQFESYRALGFHAVCEAFSAAFGAERCTALDDVEIFTLLRQRWGEPAPAPPDALRKYSSALERIWTTVRTTDSLRFLDSQMFPEFPALLAVPYGRITEQTGQAPVPAVNYWLPSSDEERRAGFYVCVQMLQLMEDVFLDFELDEYYDHVDNRGWMNLFQHWGWSGMLCATWAMTGSTFDPRFQRFCMHRLDLRPGVPAVADMQAAIALPDPDRWRQWFLEGDPERTALLAEWQSRDGLNFWEAELVDKYMRATRDPAQRLFPIHVAVESPRRSDGSPLRFNVGYIIGDVVVAPGAAPRFVLHYMRVQNHLRKMGLARDALVSLQRTLGVELLVGDPSFDLAAADGKASDEALPSADGLVRLRGIVRSLPRK